MNNQYRIDNDCKLFRELRGMSQAELAEALGFGIATIIRWENLESEPSKEGLEKFYSYVYQSGVRLNAIKEQFYREELQPKRKVLFHGAKSVIDGEIRCDLARHNNDFGKGFYMGESFRQASLFVSNFESSCVYCLGFNEEDLKRAEYRVDTEWMMTIACFRGRLKKRISSEKESEICKKAIEADYIIAPIADNRMYQIIDSFIDGETTDEQCRHALAATELGMQYVIRSERAVSQLEVLERCFLCDPERAGLVSSRRTDLQAAEDKVRAARIRYRGKGKYIDELL